MNISSKFFKLLHLSKEDTRPPIEEANKVRDQLLGSIRDDLEDILMKLDDVIHNMDIIEEDNQQ